ncbi:hypothetical protein [Microbacterium sp. VKM Ac-2923]|uniref:hypothetical protein n=1 Tax=Microbacterium sp. VKM Ac-2923 TaxID=2929476 RepID=UPI001FB546F4|nr:hypothetical protein [Microbacterium sp. VKM Ac-2923]MCJ1709451.1 hypothetical protein [Microbacterium sp. VKM Ac-2923]
MLPPHEVHDEHGRWRVRRAWPSSSGCDLEVVHADGRLRAGRLRDGDVELLLAGHDKHLPALSRVWSSGTTVSWRRGRRVVLRAHDGSGYVKVVRRESVAAITRAHDRAASFREGFVTPDVTLLDAAGCVHLSRVDGRTLHDLGADPGIPDAEVHAAWNGWARGWERVLAAPSAADAAPHTATAEAEILLRWRDHALRVGVEQAVAAAFDRAAAALVIDAGDATAPAHRDLHDKQVLWDGHRAGMIDLDTAARAEPALDLANLRAHVAWRRWQGRLSASRAVAALRAIDGVAARSDVDPMRIAAYEASTRLRLGAVYLFRPAWHARAAQWLGACASQTRP